MSDPKEEGAPRGVEEALTLMRQAMEQMAQQQSETRTLLLQQQSQLSDRIDQLQASHAQVPQRSGTAAAWPGPGGLHAGPDR